MTETRYLDEVTVDGKLGWLYETPFGFVVAVPNERRDAAPMYATDATGTRHAGRFHSISYATGDTPLAPMEVLANIRRHGYTFENLISIIYGVTV